MNKIEEFWYCVAPQEDLPLYKGQEISSDACTKLIALVNKYKQWWPLVLMGPLMKS